MSMVMVQVMATGMQLLSKIILNNGKFVLALITYRHLVAALCMAPLLSTLKEASKRCWEARVESAATYHTIIYSGSLASAATFCLISWAVVRRGPSYPPMFNPLTLIFVAVLEALILGAEITVGTLLGMVLIITGLYSLLGKTNEMTNMPKSSTEA
ncbi:hypothetical protein OIU77_001049 [Salix suchowensis]|uniref:WAT1-related protein n=1 Tax=Salix suchowensis TaxID=1278906 RepID=A0ABQ9B874_9ROSI|nr:hypothetical protein OIU77_001049 [Salix suchowensis]